jgi:hypothetical protein
MISKCLFTILRLVRTIIFKKFDKIPNMHTIEDNQPCSGWYKSENFQKMVCSCVIFDSDADKTSGMIEKLDIFEF